MTLIGAAGLGISAGWAAVSPTRPRARLLLVLAMAPTLLGVAVALAGPTAGTVSLGGLLLGLASRLLLDLSSMQGNPVRRND
jgi:hypothetical protein